MADDVLRQTTGQLAHVVEAGHEGRQAQAAALHGVAHPVLDRRDPLSGHHPAGDLFIELEALAPLARTDFDDDIAELTVAAGLLLVPAMLGDALLDRLLVGGPRPR